MKTILKTTAALIALSMAAPAAMAADAIRSNVPCDDGIKPGFMVQSGTIDFYAIHGTDVSKCPAGTVELPADVHPFDLDEVRAYLADIEPNVRYRLQGKNRECRANSVDPDGPAGSCFEDDMIALSVTGLDRSGTSRPVNGGW